MEETQKKEKIKMQTENEPVPTRDGERISGKARVPGEVTMPHLDAETTRMIVAHTEGLHPSQQSPMLLRVTARHCDGPGPIKHLWYAGDSAKAILAELLAGNPVIYKNDQGFFPVILAPYQGNWE